MFLFENMESKRPDRVTRSFIFITNYGVGVTVTSTTGDGVAVGSGAGSTLPAKIKRSAVISAWPGMSALLAVTKSYSREESQLPAPRMSVPLDSASARREPIAGRHASGRVQSHRNRPVAVLHRRARHGHSLRRRSGFLRILAQSLSSFVERCCRGVQ